MKYLGNLAAGQTVNFLFNTTDGATEHAQIPISTNHDAAPIDGIGAAQA